MQKLEAVSYIIQRESGLNMSDLNEFSDELVEFRTTLNLGAFDDFNIYPYFFQVDISDEETPVYSEGFIGNDGEKHTEKSFIIINEE